ncbi:MAG TPA: serine/threonine-protein kinase [Coleofasciculaceae cyanobacterium]
MSYCLNPNCSKPQNPAGITLCQSCESTLLLKDRYQALKLIGQGGFGRTFLAVDRGKASKSRCVIKQLLPQQLGTNSAQKAAELFREEAKRLKQLGKHRQIPELLAYFEQDGRQYLVQEFIDGQNLAQELAEEGAFNEIQIRELLESLLPVLNFIHRHQIVHRDIKPANIIRRISPLVKGSTKLPPVPPLIRGEAFGKARADMKIGLQKSQLVLVDFGAAKFTTGTALIKTGTTIGSAEYTAPEQIRGKAVFASDLYSLGVTCIHLLTQISPFDLFDSSEDRWVWRDYLRTPVSDSLGNVLDKLLQSATKRRYQSVDEVLSDLKPQSTQGTTKTISVSGTPVTPTQSSSARSVKTSSPAPSQTPFCLDAEILEDYSDKTRPIFPFQTPSEAPIEPATYQTNSPVAPTHKQPQQTAAVKAMFATFMIFFTGTMLRLAESNWREAEFPNQESPYSLSDSDPSTSDPLILPQIDDSASQFADTLLPLRTLTKSDLVLSLAISADGQTLISGSTAGAEDAYSGSQEDSFHSTKSPHESQIKVWNLRTGKLRHTLSTHYPVWSVAISPDGQTLVSSTTNVSPDKHIASIGKGIDKGSIQIWNLNTGELLRTIPKSPEDGMSVAISADGQTLASTGNESIKLWNLQTGELTRILEAPSSGVNSIIFSQDGQMLASTGFDGKIKIWNSYTGDLIRTLEGESGSISSIAISPDGQTLISGITNGNFGSISTWDLRTGELLRTFNPPEAVVSITISPDGKTFATGSWDSKIGTVRIRNLQTGKLLHTLNAHRSVIESLSFSPDGKTLISSSLDQTIKLWQVFP